MDEQVALMEKSYELAAKYMNGGQQEQVAQAIPTATVQGKGNAAPVKSVSDRTVSGLQQPMSNAEFVAEYSKPRNYGFNTAVGSGYSMGKNTIRACVHNDQTLMDGQTVKLRLLEPLQAGNVIVPKNSLVSGSAKVQGERLDILVSSLEYAGNIIPVELAVYDSDGQKGLSVPSSLEQEAVKRSDGEYRCGTGYEHFLCAKCRTAGRNGYNKGRDAGRFAIPCKKVPDGKSTPESELSGDALRQTAIIYLSIINHKNFNPNEKVNYHVCPTLGRGFNESTK